MRLIAVIVGASSNLFEPIPDAVEGLDHIECIVTDLNFLRSRLMWLSIVRSST
jgi:hypothetical protein